VSQEALDELKELLGLIKGQERYTNYLKRLKNGCLKTNHPPVLTICEI